MRKHLILLLLLSGCIGLLSGNITRIEYFFDTDPGAGMGNALPFTGTNVAEVSSSISTAQLTNGLHFLYIRAQDDLGKWSLLNWKPVIREGSASAVITRLEYFLDADPGPGLATQVSLTPGQEIVYNGDLSLSGASAGLHLLFLRAQNSQGYWSLLSSRIILVTPDSAPLLSRAEWYFTGTGADPGQLFDHQFTTPDTDLSDALAVSLTHLQQDGEYQMHFYVVNELGQKSLEEIYPFTVNFTPQNLQLSFNGAQVTISWSEIPGSDHYDLQIYSDPYAPGTSVSVPGTEYTEPQAVNKMYDVKAVSGD